MSTCKELLSTYWQKSRVIDSHFYGTHIDWNQTILSKFNSIKKLFDAHDQLTIQEYNLYKNKILKVHENKVCYLLIHPCNSAIINSLHDVDTENQTISTLFVDIIIIVDLNAKEDVFVMYNQRYSIVIELV